MKIIIKACFEPFPTGTVKVVVHFCLFFSKIKFLSNFTNCRKIRFYWAKYKFVESVRAPKKGTVVAPNCNAPSKRKMKEKKMVKVSSSVNQLLNIVSNEPSLGLYVGFPLFPVFPIFF